ncbi:Ubiquitin-like-conjugating enzyme ATG10 [Rhynchospora pubera]|uniref:Ubiquitin-like-conjugating enzyme ATG10 n=1 Tax=Rhynchospora pubera TaxID=906938 RepID=A0AAV8D5Z1_9POAL|nr:Ubiquitin-like-conjugating enzyme ATG10 [Rhynchospora pubera]
MRGVCTRSGSLSAADFYASAIYFSQRWNETNSDFPNWVWIPCSRLGAISEDEGYLVLEKIKLQTERNDSNLEELNNCDSSANDELTDEATLVDVHSHDAHLYDLHIAYSFTYKVPVLYFRGYKSDGCHLSLDEIKEELPSHSVEILQKSKWTFMTQEEHPYLNTPWYTLHPCGTGDWMKLLLSSTSYGENISLIQYLPAWLSVIGQTVGLRVPLELYSRS